MKKITLLIFSVSLVLMACSQKESATKDSANSSSTESKAVPIVMPERPAYTLYKPDFIGKGKKSLLFFSQNKDFFSQQSDLLLRKLYSSGSAKISTFRLDFSTATGAKFDYQVIVPDTFVLVGPAGEKIRNLIHPKEEELKRLLEERG